MPRWRQVIEGCSHRSSLLGLAKATPAALSRWLYDVACKDSSLVASRATAACARPRSRRHLGEPRVGWWERSRQHLLSMWEVLMATAPRIVSDELWALVEPLLAKPPRRFRYPG